MIQADSSSEEEDNAKLREAVWSGGTGAHSTCIRDGEKNGKQSNRVDPSKHEEDGNELQTTPEFRSHVAKKLGAILDSCILEVSSERPGSKQEKCKNKEEEEEEEEEEDEGFRVFSTSLPGKWWKEPTPPPAPKRPPAPSSSDSDSEMELRLREAAVSLSDLIGPPSTENTKEKEKIVNKEDHGTENTEPEKKKKKKKKKKAPTEGKGEEEESLVNVNVDVTQKQSTHEHITEEPVTKKKKKKKKKIKLDEGE